MPLQHIRPRSGRSRKRYPLSRWSIAGATRGNKFLKLRQLLWPPDGFKKLHLHRIDDNFRRNHLYLNSHHEVHHFGGRTHMNRGGTTRQVRIPFCSYRSTDPRVDQYALLLIVHIHTPACMYMKASFFFASHEIRVAHRPLWFSALLLALIRCWQQGARVWPWLLFFYILCSFSLLFTLSADEETIISIFLMIYPQQQQQQQTPFPLQDL